MDELKCLFADPATVRYPLGVVGYTTDATEPYMAATSPRINLHIARDPAQVVTEVWTTDRPVTSGVHNGIAFGHDGSYAFCAARVPAAPRYARGVRQAYLNVFDLLAQLGYPQIFRMWNFVGRINGSNPDGLEIYRDFCQGRAEAFDQSPLLNDALPAGTGVGSYTDGVSFYLLARRESGHTAIESRRQVPAWCYPRQYGPRSPSFARATRLPGGTMLISGTASILGHSTVHPGDITAQCRTTLSNLAVLATDLGTLDAVKVYVRHQRDVEAARQLCDRTFSGQTAYFTTDLCRIDLLVEIEGIAQTMARRSGVAISKK